MAKIERHYVCDKCKQPIVYPEEGRIFHGNVLLADPENDSGLIGDNFPQPSEKKTPAKFVREDVHQNVFCNRCIIEVLQLGDYIKQRYMGGKQDRLLPAPKPQNIQIIPPSGGDV